MGQCAHLKHYAVDPACEVVAIAEPRVGLATAVAARYGVPRTYAGPDAMVAAEKLDALVAIQPFDRHGSIVLPLYRFGLPLMTEKPLASSVETGRALLEGLELGGSWHMVGYHKRSDPAAVAVRTEIDRLKATEELGALRYVRITMPPGDWIAGGFDDLIRSDEPIPFVDADPPPAGMNDSESARYANFVNYYIHQINLMRFLLGEPYKVRWADPTESLITVQSASGTVGTIELAPYNTTIAWHESAMIGFERGYLRLDFPAPLAAGRPGSAEFFRDPGDRPPETVRPDLPWKAAMRAQASRFIACVRGDAKPPCEAAEALLDLETASDWLKATRLGGD